MNVKTAANGSCFGPSTMPDTCEQRETCARDDWESESLDKLSKVFSPYQFMIGVKFVKFVKFVSDLDLSQICF